MLSSERLFLGKTRLLCRVPILLVVVTVGLGCGPGSPPPSWSVQERLVDRFVGETDGLGRDLPVATIDDDTRYVLMKPHYEPLVWTFVHDHKEAGLIRRDALVPRRLQGQSKLVIFPRMMIKAGEWTFSEPLVAGVRPGPPPSVVVDFEAPDNPEGRRIELIADAAGTDNSAFKRIEVSSVPIESGSELRFSIGIVKPDLQTSPATFSVQACVETGCDRIFEEEFDPTQPGGSRWRDRRVSLEGWAGKNVTFRFEADGSSNSSFPVWPVWANPSVYRKQGRDPARRNVILLSIDTLRADHLSSYGYAHLTSPFIDERFARGGTVFDHPVAAGASTSPAHASIFTSVDVATHRTYDGFHTLPPGIPTLPELVRAAGIDTASYNENGWLSVRMGFGRGFDRFVENRSDNINSPSGQVDRTFDAAAQWLRENRDTPFFLFLHTYQVHTPYAPPEKYKNLF
ncbi:MAG: sulfatase, partial [Myxococcota bacterium]|nr:sulfatase [Myxococcota bacterium]